MIFFAVSLLVYCGLTFWLTGRVDGTRPEWSYTLLHLTLAAAINAHLLWVARKRNLSFLGCAPLAFLLVHHFYFTMAGLKYFSPIVLYPQFNLTLEAQLVGSLAGGAVLFACGLLLHAQKGPTSVRMQVWVERHLGDIRRLMIISVVGSVLCKIILYQLGYGSIYSESAYNPNAVRGYGDVFILLGNDSFGLLSLVFGLIYLLHPRIGHRRPLTFLLAAGGVLLQVMYALLYLKGRMILLTAPITFALAAEVVSHRRAERLVQILLLVLPPASLLGVQLTLFIGRFNLPEDTGLRLAIAAVNRRADLTDFPTAVVLNSGNQAHDVRIVSEAMLNAIPRVFFPGKEEVIKDVYSQILGDQLGWPAGFGEELQADYLDTAFSNGVLALGAVGFVALPLILVGLYGWLAAVLERTFRGPAYGFTLIPLLLAAMHIEGEWVWILLNLRQGVSFAIICLVMVAAARLAHEVVVVATRPPELVGMESR